MKILFLTENFPPETNASATRVFERAIYWLKWGHEVTIITSAPNFPQGKIYKGYKNRWRQVDRVSGIRVVRVKTYITPNEGAFKRSLDFLSFMVSAFVAGLFEKRPDIIVATSPQFFAAVGGWGLSVVRKIPFVFELGDLWPASIVAVGAMRYGILIQLIEKVELFLYRKSSAIIALTESFKRDLVSRNIAENKIAVVINGVDLSRYKPQSKNHNLLVEWGLEGKFVVGYIGTHGMAHCLENVLDAALILKEYNDICFLFVGAGAERESLIEIAEEKKLYNVKFFPNQPKNVMPDVWSVCNFALVHLKDAEAFKSVIPSKIFEAIAMGIPVLLVSPAGEASQIINQENVGVHIVAENPQKLADCVKQLYHDEETRKHLSGRCQDVAKKYSRELQASLMLEILKRVALHKGRESVDLSLVSSVRK